jgi:DNA-binding transcriptional LysR family regulator
MELSQLKVLLAVLEASSVTRAADVVGLSPGAVSQQLHTLANGLGTELFVRSGKRIVPTPAALRVAEHARTILHEVHAIHQEFANDPDSDTRPFHIAAGATTLIHRLGAPLRAVRKRFPKPDIHVTVAATEEMVEGLLNRRFDLCLLSMPVVDERLTFLPLFDEELLGLRPLPKPARSGKVVTIHPQELANATFLLYPKRSNMRSIIDGFFREIGLEPRVSMEADDTEAIKSLVEAGYGYSILPEFALRRQSRFFQIFRVAGHRLVRKQALATVRAEYPRMLTVTVARMMQAALTQDQPPSYTRVE